MTTSRLNTLLTLCIVLLFAGSCVSKKKFDEANAKYHNSLKENKNLKNLNKELKTGFEAFKSEMLKSNNKKDQELLLLQASLKEEQRKQAFLEKELENTQSLFDNQKNYEDSQLSRINELNKEIRELRAQTTSLEYSLTLARQKEQANTQKIEELRQSLTERNTKENQNTLVLNQKQKEIDALSQTIEKNKKTLAKINSSFIELRKELLRAKGKGEFIDPNTNKHVENIAKQLPPNL